MELIISNFVQVSFFKICTLISSQIIVFISILLLIGFPILEFFNLKYFLITIIIIFIIVSSLIVKSFLEFHVSGNGIQQQIFFIKINVGWNDPIDYKKGKFFTYIFKKNNRIIVVLPGLWLLKNNQNVVQRLINYTSTIGVNTTSPIFKALKESWGLSNHNL